MSYTLVLALACCAWHIVWGDPMSTKGAHGWVPVIGFCLAVAALAGAP